MLEYEFRRNCRILKLGQCVINVKYLCYEAIKILNYVRHAFLDLSKSSFTDTIGNITSTTSYVNNKYLQRRFSTFAFNIFSFLKITSKTHLKIW